MKPIVYVAGKSGGHIIPALTLAQKNHLQPALFISTDATLDKQLVGAALYIQQHHMLPLSGFSLKNPLGMFKLLRSWVKSVRILWRSNPERVVSTGGLVALPVCCAAWFLRIPYELYEFNVEPGAAIKLLASRAERVHICFPYTKKYLKGNIVVTPYPMRYRADDRMPSDKARSLLHIAPDKKVLLVIGGSQGSRFFNTLMQQFVVYLSEKERLSLHIIHQTGVADALDMYEFYKEAGVAATVFDYRDDIAMCYQAADYTITRAGAGVLHELVFFHKSGLIIPLEVASTSHQIANAQACVQQYPDTWMMLRQVDLQKDAKLLHETIKAQLLRD